VTQIEKIIEPFADKLRTNQAELARVDNPMRFVVKQVDNDIPLITIPREYNDCLITLVTRTDPLRRSQFVSELVRDTFIEDVKANSLDIRYVEHETLFDARSLCLHRFDFYLSYFPGGVNYDVPRDNIDVNGQMTMETYQKLKKRLTNRKVRHFQGPPMKKVNALLAIIPVDTSVRIDHQCLIEAIYDRLRMSPTWMENVPIDQRIRSIEYLPLDCILNSNEMDNQFIIDCDTIETKQELMGKPLTIIVHKQTITIDLQSHDEQMQREYEKFVKSEKYRELIRNHDEAKNRTVSTKK
jgi:hypothetical protein